MGEHTEPSIMLPLKFIMICKLYLNNLFFKKQFQLDHVITWKLVMLLQFMIYYKCVFIIIKNNSG